MSDKAMEAAERELCLALEVSTTSTPNVFVCGRCGKRFEWTCSNASANQKNATDE